MYKVFQIIYHYGLNGVTEEEIDLKTFDSLEDAEKYASNLAEVDQESSYGVEYPN